MGAVQGDTLNQGGTTLEPTSAYSGDPGDGTTKWFHWTRIANGGHAATGATTDAAVTDPTSSGSLVALLKGLLTFLRVSAVGVGKAEDAAHVSGDTGIMALAVRRDTAAASSGASGDYEPLSTDNTGRLRIIDDSTPGYPSGATPIVATSAVVANAAATATLTAAASVTTWIHGFVISGSGATASSSVTVTVTGPSGGPLNFPLRIPAGATTAIQRLVVQFPAPIPASAVNTAITVSAPAFGAGNTQAAAVAYGFRK